MFSVHSVCVFVVPFFERYFQICWDVGGSYYWGPGYMIFEKVAGSEM